MLFGNSLAPVTPNKRFSFFMLINACDFTFTHYFYGPYLPFRFDMIYIVKDEHNEARDITLAKHVMNIHMNAAATEDDSSQGELSLSFLKKFINYSRSRCGPRLSKVKPHLLHHHLSLSIKLINSAHRDWKFK